MYLQPLTEIHLNPHIEQEFKPANNPKYLYIFGIIAVMIIIIASVNFMNLSTAQASKRAKEAGVKKSLWLYTKPTHWAVYWRNCITCIVCPSDSCFDSGIVYALFQ